MNTNLTDRFEHLYNEFNDPKGRIMVVSHRGDWLSAPENTLSAISNAIASGVDMIELDVQRTRDGHLILMHDTTVGRMTNGSGAVAELTYDELLALRVKHAQGGDIEVFTDEHIPTLTEAMTLAKGKVFINLDKCWDIREQVYDVLLETGTVNHGLFKSEAEPDEVMAFMKDKPIRPEYMQIIHTGNAHLLHNPAVWLTKIKPKAIEFVFENESDPHAIEEAFYFFYGTCRIWVNTMWDSLCAGYSDEKSLENTANGWAWWIARKVNMIQTDYSQQLLSYLRNC